MPNTVNYATQFEKEIMQKYSRELLTADLTTQNVTFVGANKIKIPFVSVTGYKDHSRNGGFNRGSVQNQFMEKTLSFDRDIEFFVDAMDVDETNQALSAANITNTFITEQDVPETDCYRLSKLHTDFTALGGTVTQDAVTAATILDKFDTLMEEMDEDEVPEEGRILYLTPNIYTMLKQAEKITRSLDVTRQASIDRHVRNLDEVKMVRVPSSRMKTVYDFTEGFKPGAAAKQMNMILVHPKSVIASQKHSYIKLWPEGTHTNGDGYLYQNRKYGDLFLIDTRVQGVKINLAPNA
ncbi:MAG: capsid protein [Lachnospiraceae bacterium]